MSFDFFQNEQSATLLNAARHPSTGPEAGAFTNFLPGAASYGMRSLAEVGRAVSMAGAVVPLAIDAITQGDNFSGRSLADRYFENHDEVFGRAVDYWTPKPGEVGMAGQIAGQLAGGVLQAAISPALLVATTQLATGEDLVRQGVDANTAGLVGGIGGAGTAVGLRLPFLGSTLTSRVASGVAGNVVQGAGVAAAQRGVLNAAGNTEQAQQFDPLDLRARALDALLGAAFGGMAHLQAKLSPVDQAALLVANQARHLEDATAPGVPATAADLTQHVEAMHQAIGQVLRGEPVAVDKITEGMRMADDPAVTRQRTEVADEFARLVADETPAARIEAPAGDQPIRAAGTDAAAPDLTAERARAALERNPDLLMPVNDDGAPPERAADVLQRLADARKDAEQHAPDLYTTAAACLLGTL